MSERLAGQTAWISGGASGIGAATARLLAREGARVTVADVRQDEGRLVVEEIVAEGGEGSFSFCDVGQGDLIKQSLDEAAARWGDLGIVVNCAGVVHVGLLHDYDERDWDRLMAINVKSIFHSLKYALPYLQQRLLSYMVNVASISSFVGQAATPAYTTSKGAVLSLTRSIALDYAGLGLRCNCVCPGITDTPMLREHLGHSPEGDEKLRQRVQRVPLHRVMHPDDIAHSILYLCCEDSAGVTGASVVIDGGYLAAAEWNAAEAGRAFPSRKEQP